MSLKQEIERRLLILPELPFFASLTDPRQHLSPVELARAPHLAAGRAFIVQRVEVDRTLEQPGIWLQTLQTRLYHKTWPQGFGPDYVPGQPLWLNAEWCVIYGTRDTQSLFPN